MNIYTHIYGLFPTDCLLPIGYCLSPGLGCAATPMNSKRCLLKMRMVTATQIILKWGGRTGP